MLPWCWAAGLRYSKHLAEGTPTQHLVDTRDTLKNQSTKYDSGTAAYFACMMDSMVHAWQRA